MIGFNGSLVSCDIASIEVSRRTLDSGVRAHVVRQKNYASSVSFIVEGGGVRVCVMARHNQTLAQAYEVAKQVKRHMDDDGFSAYRVKGATVFSVAPLDGDDGGAKVYVSMFPDRD